MKPEQQALYEVMVANDLLAALGDGLKEMASAEQVKAATTVINVLSQLKDLKGLGQAMVRFKALPEGNRNEVFGLVRAKLTELRIGA